MAESYGAESWRTEIILPRIILPSFLKEDRSTATLIVEFAPWRFGYTVRWQSIRIPDLISGCQSHVLRRWVEHEIPSHERRVRNPRCDGRVEQCNAMRRQDPGPV